MDNSSLSSDLSETVEQTHVSHKSPFDSKIIFITSIFFVLILVSLLIILLGSRSKTADRRFATSSLSPTPTSASRVSTNDMTNWKTYTNTTYDYSLKYPESWYLTKSEDN